VSNDIVEGLTTSRNVRIVWSAVGDDELHVDSLADVSETSARIYADAGVPAGTEIRFELLEESEKLATGLAKVTACEANAITIGFLALGIDPAVLARLRGAGREQPPASIRKPPPPIPAAPRPIPKAAPKIVEAGVAKPAVGHVESDPFAAEEEEISPEIEPLAIKKTGVIIGIDLGTTNTCAAHVVDGRPKIIPGRTGTSTIPSMITFDPDGRWYVGQRAADRQILYPLRTVYGSKRLVGRTYRSDIAADLQQHFAYPLGEADGQRFGVRVDDRVIPMDTIAARVLDEVRSTAEAHLKCPVEAAIVTVPAYFSEVQRDAVRRAAREANLVVHRIVNEPTAAAVAYGHKSQSTKRARVAVWDFGGGTFDFSVVDVTRGSLEVLASGGDNFVGGSDFDDLLASHLLTEFQRLEGMSFEPEPQQIARLREAAQAAKCHLSAETEHVVALPEFTKGPDGSKKALRVEVTRSAFEALAKPLIDRTVAISLEVLQSVKLTPKDVDDVLLVGGTTRIPAVQEAVAALFGRRPSKGINPDEAVALGAALLADEIGSANAPTLLDILPMTIGYGVSGLRFVPVVARNSRLPAQQDVTFDADFMGNVTLPLFQGESLDVSANEYLCSVIVEDRSLWDNGRVTLRLSFDEHCIMAVDAKNARTGKALPTRLDRTRSVEEILRELGKYEGPPVQPKWSTPPSRMGKLLGKLFKVFGR
jgi:molecular chaperone DnaK